MAILKLCTLVVSEDSALFHMAWAMGIPSLLLLSSTRADWTCHTSKNVICLNSNDLSCGNCMAPECKYGDVHCLSRFTPKFVFEKAKKLLSD
jgi:ADP-heptose:LPS heptosyltransferase